MTDGIRDQRTMVGPYRHRTVEDVESFWRAHAQEVGFTKGHSGAPRPLNELRETDVNSPVFVSMGQWVANCPNPLCNGAAACWQENPRACCLDCGTVFTPVWPTKKEIGGDLEDLVEVLSHRPKPEWRNFRASPGHELDTLDDLKAENLGMGDAIPGGKPAKGPHPLDRTLIRG